MNPDEIDEIREQQMERDCQAVCRYCFLAATGGVDHTGTFYFSAYHTDRGWIHDWKLGKSEHWTYCAAFRVRDQFLGYNIWIPMTPEDIR